MAEEDMNILITGDPSVFAIESGMTKAYERLGFLALGYFMIHIGGKCYGVKEPDATLLAIVFDEALRIVRHRGLHVAPFSAEPNAAHLIESIYKAVFEEPDDELLFGLTNKELISFVNSSRCCWHWFGDEAFDDGSVIYHFDIGDKVRLIATSSDNPSVTDQWIDAEVFYRVVAHWWEAFEEAWKAADKIPEAEDGAIL